MSERTPGHRALVVAASMVAGVVWTAYLLLNSPGIPVQDELGHYFISRDAWNEPSLMLHAWGRAVNTIVYMPGAYFSFEGSRATSVLMAALTALLAMVAAARMKCRYAFLVPLLFWAQPWVSDLSYAAITEIPFSLAMIAGVWLFLSKRYRASALVLGLLPLIRHEGIALTGLCMAYFLWRRNWQALVLAAVPLVVYNGLYYAVFHKWMFASFYFRPKPTEFYGRGTWSHYVPGLAAGIGAAVAFLAASAFLPIIRSSDRVKVFVFYVSYLVMHVVIYRFGLFGSGGYTLFLLPLAPAAAVAAAFGLEFLVEHGKALIVERNVPERKRAQFVTTFLVACMVLVLVIGSETRPRPLSNEARLMREVATWLHANELDEARIVHTHPWIHFFMPLATKRVERIGPPDDLPPGTIVVWDYHYSPRYGFDLEKMRKDTQRWQVLQAAAGGHVVIFRKVR